MTLLAKNNNGLHNLFRMSSLASLEGFYFKPRLDRELLRDALRVAKDFRQHVRLAFHLTD